MNGRGRLRARGVTLVEVIAASGTVAVLLVIAVVLLTMASGTSQPLKIGTAMRGWIQGAQNWAQDNQGSFPLPSTLDKNDATVREQGRAKDTTSNIYSMLIWVQAYTPELHSFARNAPWFEVKQNYEYSKPKSAVDPEHALWDPSFSADFSGGKKANSGFAHLQPAGGRFDRWTSPGLRNALTPMLSERGAEITGSAPTGPNGAVEPIYKDQNARMLTLEAGKAVWRGNAAFGDCHVEYVMTPSARPGVVDFTFWDEPNDAAAVNDFLGIFRTAGDTPARYQAIWD